MFLQPRKVKWRKQRRGSHKGFAYRGNKLAFGEYGIQALDRFYMTQRQIEAVRVTLVRSLKKGAKININTHIPEFSQYKFVKTEQLNDYITFFKRTVYKKVLKYFKKEGYI